MKKNLFTLMLGVLAIAIVFTSCKKDNEDNSNSTIPTTGAITLELEHMFGAEEFALNTTYTRANGETVNFSSMKYFVSNITFTKTDGTQRTITYPDSHFLIDLATPSSAILTLPGIAPADFSAITFTIGVDSAACVNANNTGALDHTSEMYLSATEGYIMSWFEGTTSATAGSFNYQLAGFAGNEACQRTGTWEFAPYLLSVYANATPQLHMSIDVQQLFDNELNTVDLSTTNSVTSPGPVAAGLAENFFSGIEFEHIHN
jgi:hypothetical protein